MKVVKTEVNAYEFYELTKEVQQRVCDGIFEDLKDCGALIGLYNNTMSEFVKKTLEHAGVDMDVTELTASEITDNSFNDDAVYLSSKAVQSLPLAVRIALFNHTDFASLYDLDSFRICSDYIDYVEIQPLLYAIDCVLLRIRDAFDTIKLKYKELTKNDTTDIPFVVSVALKGLYTIDGIYVCEA